MYEVGNVPFGEVLTITADATVEEAIRCLVQNNISGMPVVDEDENLIGIISEFQLLETLYNPKTRAAPVGDMMTRDVLTVALTTSLADATSLMVIHRIRRLPVVDNGKIVGVVSRRDLLKYAMEAGDRLDDFLDELKICACPSASA